MTDNNEFDKRDLKIQALLEKVSSLTTNYENQIADLRVELTVTSNETETLRRAVQENSNVSIPQEVSETSTSNDNSTS